MFFRILKKNLKRKKTMNIILFAFILLATMFVSSGLSNVAAVMNGTDYFLKKAGVGDYVVIMMGTDTDDPIKDVLKEQEDVKEYRKENVVFGNKSDLTDTKGKALEARNATVYQAIEDSKLKFFDSKNEKITSIEPGHAYATGDFLQKNDLQPGDKIMITYGNVKLSVILDGEAKDALLGSSMMGNNRFLLSKQDEGKLAEDTVEGVQQGKIYYIDLKSGADEPTGALNRTSSNEVMDELVKLNKEGTTIVMVTHDAKVASRCSRVLFIVDGNIKGEYTELSDEADPNRRERGLNNWLMDQGW